MTGALSALVLLLTRYGFVLDIASWVWSQFQTYEQTKKATTDDTTVSEKIDASVAGASDADLDERLRHFQRD